MGASERKGLNEPIIGAEQEEREIRHGGPYLLLQKGPRFPTLVRSAVIPPGPGPASLPPCAKALALKHSSIL